MASGRGEEGVKERTAESGQSSSNMNGEKQAAGRAGQSRAEQSRDCRVGSHDLALGSRGAATAGKGEDGKTVESRYEGGEEKGGEQRRGKQSGAEQSEVSNIGKASEEKLKRKQVRVCSPVT